jgi:hypothetical protein
MSEKNNILKATNAEIKTTSIGLTKRSRKFFFKTMILLKIYKVPYIHKLYVI